MVTETAASAAELWVGALGRPVETLMTGSVRSSRSRHGWPTGSAARPARDGPYAGGDLLRRLDSYDRAAYRSVARLRMPLLDEPLRLVSDFANFSKPWFLVSGLLALFGGSSGQACRAHRVSGDRRDVPGGEPAHEDGR